MELVILIGAQASGKSTFYQERFRDSHVRINRDMLHTKHREMTLFNTCLALNQPVVVDNTNVAPEDRARFIQPARDAGFQVIGYYFESAIKTLMERNRARPSGQRVPDLGVLGTHKRLVLPISDEGFDQLKYVRIRAGRFEVEDWANEV